MKIFNLFVFILISISGLQAQNLYFPPLTGNNWDTISPSSLGWCQSKIDTFYNFLESRNTESFIVLKDGKIVLEKYFGTFAENTPHYWASSGKSLTAMLIGIAQDKNLVQIDSSVSTYLGTSWTTAPLQKENLIKVKNLLSMNSGLDDTPTQPCVVDDTTAICMEYLTDPNTRWAYHNGAYKKLHQILTNVSNLTLSNLTNSFLGSKIGLTGFYFDGTYYSKTRGAARFGLLSLNKGIWNGDTVLRDTNYFNSMINTSQTFNNSYGYLWWLNGKTSFMAPGIPFVFNGSLLQNAPPDTYAALGKNDQKIYVVPSQKLVIVRFGESAYGTAAAFSPFDDEIWGYINNLTCSSTSIEELSKNQTLLIYPNPFTTKINLNNPLEIDNVILTNVFGQLIYLGNTIQNEDFSKLKKGIYLLQIQKGLNKYYQKIIKE